MSATLEAPRLGGSRSAARALVSELPPDLRSGVLTLDLSAMEVAPSSFVDEFVRVVLVERPQVVLRLLHSNERVWQRFSRAARAHHVMDRLQRV